MDTAIAERGYYTPNDPGILAETDSRSIQRAVDAALKTGMGRVVIPRYNKRTGKCQWDVDEAVILDSNLEIVLDNCYIRQMDGSMDNVFRNFPDDGLHRRALAQEQHDIIIRGVGNPVIDGGVGNGLTQKTSMKDGRPRIYKNNLIWLHNLRRFRLENFTLANQRHWAINLNYCEYGRITGLNLICRNDLRNQDGLDMRVGCNNILIDGLTGRAGDDFIALSGFLVDAERYAVEGKSSDIHDIIISNIRATSAECTLVGMRCQDGIKIYNVTVDNVHDVMGSQESTGVSTSTLGHLYGNRYAFPWSPYAVIRIGHDDYIRHKACAPGDVHSIHISNIHARCNGVIMLNSDIENSTFRNIYAGPEVDRIITTSACRAEHPFGVDMRNVVIENVYWECSRREGTVAFDFVLNQKTRTMEDVFIRDVFPGECAQVLDMQHKGTVTLTGIHGMAVKERIRVAEGSQVLLEGEPVKPLQLQ